MTPMHGLRLTRTLHQRLSMPQRVQQYVKKRLNQLEVLINPLPTQQQQIIA